MSLSVVTVCSGRTDYLSSQLEKIFLEREYIDQHIFVQNGFELKDENILSKLSELGSEKVYQKNILPIGATLKKVTGLLKSSHVLKLDDDAIPISCDFFKRISEIIRLFPDASFSPFPVGLLLNLGGPKIKEGKKWEVVYSDFLDIYFTLREVNHVGGFCRVTPRDVYEQIDLNEISHSEDIEFSAYCKNNKLKMFYLENGLVVEHAETHLGQMQRNPVFSEYIKDKKISYNEVKKNKI